MLSRPFFPTHAFLPCYIAIGLGSPRQSGNLFPTGSSVLQEEKGAESKIPQKRTAALRQLPHTDFSCVCFPKSRRILRKHHSCLRRNYRSAAEKAAAGTFRAGQQQPLGAAWLSRKAAAVGRSVTFTQGSRRWAP